MGSCFVLIVGAYVAARNFYAEKPAAAKRRLHGDVAAEPARQGPGMGEPDAFAGHILDAGAAKQLENALVVSRRDSASVVLHIDHDKGPGHRSRDVDDTGAI